MLQFADDLVIWAASSSRAEVTRKLSEATEKIEWFLHSKGLDLSISKSASINFTRSTRSRPDREAVVVHRREIPVVAKHRFLGVLIDRSFSGRAHLEYITNKCRSIVNVISSLAGVWWGAHPLLLLNVYRALMRSVMEYGHQIFFTKGNLTKLEVLLKLRNRALRTALGYRASTPINVILDEAREPPFLIRMEMLNTRFIYRCAARLDSSVIGEIDAMAASSTSFHRRVWMIQNIPTVKTYIKIKDDLAGVHGTAGPPCFSGSLGSLTCRPEYVRCFLQDNGDRADIMAAFREQVGEILDGALTIYTDGSRTSGEFPSTGAGVYSPELNVRIYTRLPGIASIFSAEAWAIVLALELCLEQGKSYKNVVVLSDSRSVLDAVTSADPFPKNYLISRIRELVLSAREAEINVTMVWIPSHRGIIGNEEADRLAAKAHSANISESFKIPFADLYTSARSNMQSAASEFHKNKAQEKGKLYFQHFHSNAPRP
ncbi:PREDICTED: uncharacterized protein LOC105558127 [Vollenhovia emeryi]|uniref:uncharacterized protein LOC105558127 n=1 Tax=Vollenhovia emeryi TaxID=411798 RepID=UPI0005F4024E|nr:PREDICTED: uncharacterized protein LOC105558127 [Vollenhovia emeryi]